MASAGQRASAAMPHMFDTARGVGYDGRHTQPRVAAGPGLHRPRHAQVAPAQPNGRAVASRGAAPPAYTERMPSFLLDSISLEPSPAIEAYKGGIDRTLLREIEAERDPRVRVFFHEKNAGKGAALAGTSAVAWRAPWTDCA